MDILLIITIIGGVFMAAILGYEKGKADSFDKCEKMIQASHEISVELLQELQKARNRRKQSLPREKGI